MWMWLGLVGIVTVVGVVVVADSHTQPPHLTTRPPHSTTQPPHFTTLLPHITMVHQQPLPASRQPTQVSEEAVIRDISGSSDIKEGRENCSTAEAINVNGSHNVVEDERICLDADNSGLEQPASGLANLTEQYEKGIDEEGVSDGNWEGEQDWQECGQLALSQLVREGFHRAVTLGEEKCARLWCSHVQGSEERHYLGGVYYVVQLGYVAEDEHECLLNITKMVVLHHS